MTIAEWLDARTPAPPPRLARRLRAALAPVMGREVRELPEAAVAAAEAILRALLDGGCTGRAQALDLLTADALVTYAFEAAGDEPDAIAARADDAMRRLAALASGAGA